MIKKFKPKIRNYWHKKFIWYPRFFEYKGDMYFVFMNYVEVRQWIGSMFGGTYVDYRPLQE